MMMFSEAIEYVNLKMSHGKSEGHVHRSTYDCIHVCVNSTEIQVRHTENHMYWEEKAQVCSIYQSPEISPGQTDVWRACVTPVFNV